MIYVSHLLDDVDMRDVIERTGAGVESIEFSISENLDRLEEKIDNYEKRLEEMGCGKLVLHGPFLDLNPMAFDSLVLDATRKRYDQAYQAAERLGAEKLVFHTCYVPDVYLLIGWADRVAEFYKRFLDGRDGIQIVMENVFDREAEPILEVARKVDHPDFGICLYIGHAHCYSEMPAAAWAELFGSYIRHMHVHDNLGDRDTHMGLGRGNLDYREVIGIVKRNNPEVSFTVECSGKKDVLQSVSALQVL